MLRHRVDGLGFLNLFLGLAKQQIDDDHSA